MREYLTRHQLNHLRFGTIENLQQRKFKAIVHHMLPHVKAYSDLFKEYGVDPLTIKNVSDWKTKGLPLLKKAQYKQHPEDFVVKVHPSQAFEHYKNFLNAQESAAMVTLYLKALTERKQLEKEIKNYFMPKMPAFSAGTESGRPTPVFITATQKQTMKKVLEIATEIILEQFKPEGHLVGMNLFPYAPHLGWHAVHEALDIAADLNLSTAAGGAIPTDKIIEMAEAFKANIYAGMSDYLRNKWLSLAVKKKAKLPAQAIFINGATKMHEAERQKIAELAKKVGVKKAVVLDFLGASEFKEAMLPECSPGTGFHHIAPLSTIIKTVTAEGTEKGGWITEWDFVRPEKGGYAASWNIDGAGTLLEGYFVGDVYERVERTRCDKCRLNVDRIFNVSRVKDTEAQLKLTGMVEAKIKGSRIDLVAIRDALLKLPEVAEAQVVAKKTQLTLRIAAQKKAEPKIRNAIQKLGLEVTPKIEWTTIEKLTEHDGFKYDGIVIE